MEKPLISIIIPCYNVEKYIDRCLQSVVCQTYSNIEVLLIDDCGTDGTMDKIASFISNYEGAISFTVIKQEYNQGQSAGRNVGIRHAKGKYLYFMDSDDYISEDCLQLLYHEFEKDPSVQMAIGNYEIVGSAHFEPMLLQQRTYTSDEIIDLQLDYKIYTMPWNKLVRKDFIIEHDLFFAEGLIHEDNLWSFCSAFCYDRISVVLKKTYFYVIHASSTERSKTQEFHEDQLFKVHCKFIEFVHDKAASIRPDVLKNRKLQDFIKRETQHFVMGAYKRGDIVLSKQRYDTLRSIDPCMSSVFPAKLAYTFYCRKNRKYHPRKETHAMKLSILTINYNNLDGLKRTIPSILSQTYMGYELIVVDGGSTDGSKEYIQATRRINKWVSEPDKGIYNAMNKAVAMASGEYCLFMNSGDTFLSAQDIEKCIERLIHYDIIAGRSIYMEQDKAYPFIPPTNLDFDFLFVNALCHQSVFISRDVLIKHPFDESYRIVSDWEQYFRAWYLHDCTYESLDDFISVFYLDGISANNKLLDKIERDKAIRKLIDDCEGDKKLQLQTAYSEFLKQHPDYNVSEADLPLIEDSLSSGKNKTQLKRKEYKLRLQNKIKNAMNKRSPFLRDLYLVKYGIKFFFKDLFA